MAESSRSGSEFSPRPYQLEILEKALEKNVIVCLGTGTGKTFISVLLIKELGFQIRGNLKRDGKRTFFIVNTVPLVNQQSKAIETHTNLKVGKYSGDMGVDFWDKQRWEEEFDGNDVLVMTAQILCNMLCHGFIKLSNINLLLVDECHHAAGNHPYAKIMEFMSECEQKPRIMGLTASIINKKPKKISNLHTYLEKSMRDLECMMQAVCETCFDQNATAKYATKPVESVEVFNPTRFDRWPEVAELDESIGEQLYSADLFLGKVKSLSSSQYGEQCLDAVKELLEIRSSLGLWCTFKAAICIRKNLASQCKMCVHKTDAALLQMVITKLKMIERMFKIFAKDTFETMDKIVLAEPLITSKAMLVMDLLRQRKQGLCAIVFVQMRVTSTVLSGFINDMASRFPESYGGIRSDFVYGHNIEEVLKGGNMTSRNQEKVLQGFRNGDYNVLVSTSVVEEGVDVRKCNLVIKFDGINNYREYVQSKGRARANGSAFIVLADQYSEASTEKDLEIFKEIEKILHAKSHGREEPTEDEIAERFDEEQLIKPFKISNEEGAPRISKDNAIMLLHMYCSKLPSDRFSVSKPVCKVSKDDCGEFSATVRLPMNCPIKETIEGESMPTKKLAKVSAAQIACIELHRIGELDDNFLPVKDLDTSDDSDGEGEEQTQNGDTKAGTKKARRKYKRKIADSFNVPYPFPSTGLYLYELQMTLKKPREDACSLSRFWYHEGRKGFGLITAKRLPEIPYFPLFTKAGEISVDVVPVQFQVVLQPDQLQSISQFHQLFFKEFAASFLENREFSTTLACQKYLLVPLLHGPESFLQDICGGRSLESAVDFGMILKFANPDGNTSFHKDVVVRKTYCKNEQPFYVLRIRYDIKISDRIAENKPTYKDYYKTKYGKSIRENQPLLESVGTGSRINHITPRYAAESGRKETQRSNVIHLVPELCVQSPMPASLHCQALCIPSLLFRLETLLIADEFRSKLVMELRPVHHLKRRKMRESRGKDDLQRVVKGKKAPLVKKRCNSKTFEEFFEISDGSQEDSEYFDQMAESLKKSLSGSQTDAHNGIRVSDIIPCLTTVKANAGFDLERHETLGDTLLKLATSVALYFKHSMANEGRLTQKRKHLISNKKLASVAKSLDLQSMIVNTAFGVKQTGKEQDAVYELARNLWVPPMYIKSSTKTNTAEMKNHDEILVNSPVRISTRDFATSFDPIIAESSTSTSSIETKSHPSQVIGDKSLADSVEALIGVCYEFQGVNYALDFLKLLGIDCFYEETSDGTGNVSNYANFPTPPSALIESEDSTKRLKHLYRSNRLKVLEQRIKYSFKDKSFLIQAMTHMSYESNRATDCYQRLEFLGDSILDFLVISYLCENHPELTPSDLTSIKSAMVNNNTFSLLSVKYKLNKCLMHSSPSLIHAVSEFVQKIEDGSEKIESLFKNPFIIVFDGSNEDQEGYCAPKVLGDVFESLAGAVFLDSGLDLVSVWRVFFPMLKPLLDAYVEFVPINPVRKLYESFSHATPSCEQLENGKMKCTWTVNGERFEGIGQSSSMARAAAAHRALHHLMI